MSFSLSKPTTQMLGRWQPWHDGHTELFKRAIKETGQVAIMVRNILDKDNPFEFHQISSDIQWALKQIGYEHHIDYIIMQVPNIVDISYGRGVGYTFTEHDLGKEIHNISATNIRKEMRENGEL
jgi:hypothetical protein